jgi:hypothetical protein
VAIVVEQTRLDWAASFSRVLISGTAEAYVGPYDIIVISKPWTTSEDHVMKWVQAQDGGVLVDCAPLQDGRDVMLISRDHSRQDQDAAVAESRRFIMNTLVSNARGAVVVS